MVYVVDIFGKGNMTYVNLDDARRYAMTKVSDGIRGYIYAGDIDGRLVGFVAYDGPYRWWHSRNKTWLLNDDGSLGISNEEFHKKKKKDTGMHPFGL